ncbi:MAG: alpha/beta hydrolase [Gemmatimonadota bacterium]|nr:MAG: alpha/beta hydrolase [Gemmatimonadota bacterium]
MLRRPDARCMLVLAHGAGAGMRHRFMGSLAEELAGRGVATLRYNFPYVEAGRRRPDYPNVLVETVRAAIAEAARLAPDLPLLAGGKSMGGRMTSTAASLQALPGVKGLVFFGFPLHPPAKPGRERAEHLSGVTVPMLFLQGTRDRFAKPELIHSVLDDLGDQATLQLVEGADHAFHVLKRSGRTEGEVLAELAQCTGEWATAILARRRSGGLQRPS